MIHLTLNTGDARESPRHEVRDDVIAALRPLVREGGGPLPGFASPYRVVVVRAGRDAVFTVFNAEDHPVLTCGLAQDDGPRLWTTLVRLMHPFWSHGPRAARPETTPWLAVALLPSASQTPPEDLYALADVERCLAWAIIEEMP